MCWLVTHMLSLHWASKWESPPFHFGLIGITTLLIFNGLWCNKPVNNAVFLLIVVAVSEDSRHKEQFESNLEWKSNVVNSRTDSSSKSGNLFQIFMVWN